MVRACRLFGALVLAALVPLAAAAQNPAQFQVQNVGFQRVAVVVYDDVCHALLFDGLIEGESSIALSACPLRSNYPYANVRVFDRRTGISRRYTGVMEGRTISLRR